ncbi:copper-binding protein [Polynucleobacter antarcticus]|uniref:RND transporter n=1 Tax=Polynucleobacter antarcticus TaxID=1743162 RepID=A0A6M9PK13_9BURK|nr:copper-binding protein [Polynucleobacter antarcticus]QKM62464.1 RND transporter [Polynucleobacter antarcticus]
MKLLLSVFLSFLALQAFANPEWVNGEIVRIDPSRNRMIVKHEYIPSIRMAAMTMPFGVGQGIALDQYRPGDKVRFQIKVVDGTLDITIIEKLK